MNAIIFQRATTLVKGRELGDRK